MACETKIKPKDIEQFCGSKPDRPDDGPCDRFSAKPVGCIIDPNLSGVCGNALASGLCENARVSWVPGYMSREGFQPK